ACVLSLVLGACREAGDRSRERTAGTNSVADDSSVISALVTGEETLLKLTPKMSALSKGVLDLRLPGQAAETIFAPSASVTDVGPPPALSATGEVAFVSKPWPVAKEEKKGAQLDLWRPLLDSVSWFEHAKVFIIDGEHPDGDAYRYEATGGFSALAKMKS